MPVNLFTTVYVCVLSIHSFSLACEPKLTNSHIFSALTCPWEEEDTIPVWPLSSFFLSFTTRYSREREKKRKKSWHNISLALKQRGALFFLRSPGRSRNIKIRAITIGRNHDFERERKRGHKLNKGWVPFVFKLPTENISLLLNMFEKLFLKCSSTFKVRRHKIYSL